jgi:hypothetical protein
VTDKTSGHLILLHDLTFAEQRGAQARTWITIALAGVALIGAALAAIFALLVVRRWLQSIRRAVDDIKAGRNGGFNLSITHNFRSPQHQTQQQRAVVTRAK